MKELDLICYSNYGVSIHDLPEIYFRDAYFFCGNSPLDFVHKELGTLDELARCIFR
jgi:hypothetical protein